MRPIVFTSGGSVPLYAISKHIGAGASQREPMPARAGAPAQESLLGSLRGALGRRDYRYEM